LDDSSLYFSGKSNGLNRLHIADKTITQPQLNENISSNEGAAKVITVFDDYLFLNGGNSLNSIDCYAVGTYIQHIRSIDLEDPIHDLLVYNNLLFAANDSAGLKIFSAAITPGYRGLIRSYAYLTVRKTTAGVVRDHEVYLADAENGLVIIDLRPDFSN
jgi:hypothetical protein